MWKKIVDSKDLIIYEKHFKDFDAKIEARLSDNGDWFIFKKYTGRDELNYVEEFTAKSKEELGFFIKKLMKKSYSKKRLEELKFDKSRVPRFNLRRDFKEYSMEKWIFTVFDDKETNLIFIKFDEITELDIILHEKYRQINAKIRKFVNDTFNLENQAADVKLNFFYYRDHEDGEVEQQKNILIGKLELNYEEQE